MPNCIVRIITSAGHGITRYVPLPVQLPNTPSMHDEVPRSAVSVRADAPSAAVRCNVQYRGWLE
jgi:hypothetical protein